MGFVFCRKDGFMNRTQQILSFVLILFLFGITLHQMSSKSISTDSKLETSATSKVQVVSDYNYSPTDLVLDNLDEYKEEEIVYKNHIYVVLVNSKENPTSITLLTNKEDVSYTKAIHNLSKYLQKQGKTIRIKECSKTMLLSIGHTGKFQYFLLSEVKVK